MTLKQFKPSVIILTETWTKKNQSDAELNLPGYVLAARCDRNYGSLGGGVCIYVKKGIKTSDPKSKSLCRHLQTCSIKINNITYIGIYRAPNANFDTDTLLTNYLNQNANEGQILALGDFNYPTINWENLIQENPPPRSIKRLFCNLLINSGLSQIVRGSTHRSGNCLDLAFTNVEGLLATPPKIHSTVAFSDHFPVELCLSVGTTLNDSKSRIYLTRKTDWSQYKNSIKKDKLLSVCNNSGYTVDTLVGYFESSLGWAFHSSTPQVWCAQSESKSRYFTPIMRKLHRQINQMKKTREYKSADGKQRWERLHREYKVAVREGRNEYFTGLVANIKENSSAFFNYLKSVNDTSQTVGPLRNATGGLEFEEKQIATILNRNYSEVQNMSHPKQFEWEDHPPESEDKLTDMRFSPLDVARKIHRLRNKGSYGIDGITTTMLKMAVKLISTPLSLIFNRIMAEGYCPKRWKFTKMRPLYKGGSNPKEDPSSYRPVGLTSVVCKLLEALVLDKLRAFAIAKDAIDKSQHGFMSGRSTKSNLLRYWDKVTKKLEEGGGCCVCLMDASKAFDKMRHDHLLQRLKTIGVDGNVGRFIESWLVGREQFVQIGEHKSGFIPTTSGSVQGAVLSPFLFLLVAETASERIVLEKFFYCDDLKFLADLREQDGGQKMQETLDALKEWEVESSMKFNPRKSSILRIGKGQNPDEFEAFSFGGVQITEDTSARDLGIKVNRNAKFRDHLQDKVNTASKTMAMFFRNVPKRDRVTMETVWNSLIRSRLMTDAEMWWQDFQYYHDMTKAVFEKFWSACSEGRPDDVLWPSEWLKLCDMKLMKQITDGEHNIAFDEFFDWMDDPRTRQIGQIYEKPTSNFARRSSFAPRASKLWNSAGEDLKKAPKTRFSADVTTWLLAERPQ